MAVTEIDTSVELHTVTTLEEFETLRPEWDELVSAMARPSPFLLHGWLAAWWREYGDGATLAVHTARRHGELIGAAPMFVRPRLGVSVASFLGGEHSALADLLLAEDAEPAVAGLLAKRIAGSEAGYVDVHGLPETAARASARALARGQAARRVAGARSH